MRRGNDLSQLRQIAVIRDLQRLAADAEASRAASAKREKDAALETREGERQTVDAGWQAVVSAPTLAIDTLPLWSLALLRQDETVRLAARDAKDAGSELDRRATEFHAAARRSDMAGDVVRQAAKDRAAHREEAALQQASDLHVQRRHGA